MADAAASEPVLPDRFVDGELVVRRWTVDDSVALHEAIERNVEHLRPWMPWIALEPQVLEQRVALIETWEDEWRRGGDVVLAVLLDDEVAGSAGLHRRIGPGGLEIGYWIDKDKVGGGIATRVARLLTTAAFSIRGIERVEIPCDAENHRSRRVPEKLGYSFVGLRPAPILAPAETGQHRVHRMQRTDWHAAQRRT